MLLNFQIFGSILIFVLSFLFNVTMVKHIHTPDFNPLKLLRIALYPSKWTNVWWLFCVPWQHCLVVGYHNSHMLCGIKEISAKVVAGTDLEWGALPLHAESLTSRGTDKGPTSPQELTSAYSPAEKTPLCSRQLSQSAAAEPMGSLHQLYSQFLQWTLRWSSRPAHLLLFPVKASSPSLSCGFAYSRHQIACLKLKFLLLFLVNSLLPVNYLAVILLKLTVTRSRLLAMMCK